MTPTSDKIFVSYSRHDEAFARKLAVWLAKTLNIGVWIDVDDIQPGVKWSAAIQDGLDNCEVMIVIVTPEAMESVNVEDEWQYFIDLGKPVVPILLRSAAIPYQLRRIQYIDFSVREEYNESLRMLIVELRQHLMPLSGEEKRNTQTTHHLHTGAVTPTKKAAHNKERMAKAEDLLTRQERALARNNMFIGVLAFLVFGLAIGFGAFAFWVYINLPQVFTIQAYAPNAIAYLPDSQQGIPVSALENGQAPIGTRFETGDSALEIRSENGAEAVLQANSAATVNDFSEENIALDLQGGNVSVDTAGMEARVYTPNGISIAVQQNIEVVVDTVNNLVSASCYEGVCTIQDESDGRSRELEEGDAITFSSSERNFDTAEIVSIPGAIAFATFRHGAAELYLMTPDGTNQTRLTSNTGVRDYQPTWSPNGRFIAFVTDRNGNFDIAVIPSTGENPEAEIQILTADNRRADRHPAWSPDGTRIAFSSERDGNEELYVMNADGTNLMRLTENSAADNHPTWSPDGSQIAFVSTRTGNPEIFLLNLLDASAEPVNISLNPAVDEEPAWSPNGLYIAFTSNRDNHREIYIHTLGETAETVRNLSNRSGDDFEPAWSPDSSRVLFTSSRFSNNNDIVMMNADGAGEAFNVSGADNTADEDAAWLPLLRAGQ